jgi:hypothetical protein
MDFIKINYRSKVATKSTRTLVESSFSWPFLFYTTFSHLSTPHSIPSNHKTCIGLSLLSVIVLGTKMKKPPKILALEEKTRKALGLRPSRVKRESEFMQASSFVKATFESWSGSIIEKDNKALKQNGKVVRKYTINTMPFVKMLWISLR